MCVSMVHVCTGATLPHHVQMLHAAPAVPAVCLHACSMQLHQCWLRFKLCTVALHCAAPHSNAAATCQCCRVVSCPGKGCALPYTYVLKPNMLCHGSKRKICCAHVSAVCIDHVSSTGQTLTAYMHLASLCVRCARAGVNHSALP